jgi:DNA-binding Lrp family transcriptional regulator
MDDEIVIGILRRNGRLKAGRITTLAGRSPSVVRESIARLKRQGVIAGDKSGYELRTRADPKPGTIIPKPRPATRPHPTPQPPVRQPLITDGFVREGNNVVTRFEVDGDIAEATIVGYREAPEPRETFAERLLRLSYSASTTARPTAPTPPPAAQATPRPPMPVAPPPPRPAERRASGGREPAHLSADDRRHYAQTQELMWRLARYGTLSTP